MSRSESERGGRPGLTGSDALPSWAHRVIVSGVVSYFVVLGFAVVTGDDVAFLVANVLFGLIAIGFGVVILRRTAGERSPLAAGGASFVVGGVLQFAWIATGQSVFDSLASLAVFAGVGLYFYSVWYAE
ncbi:hypothetical protein ACFQGT_06500 [Natrialbaceae archaeon GCM10025810]|uniref:hypothetical protein n=1 Tax=Halovalidus salilacus TaxID=3075124 RepID=UPI00361A813B